MKCAYCGKDGKGTKEHVISKSLLDLFPECYLTYDRRSRTGLYPSDPVIRDVCSECNNKRLSYIDSYAKTWVESNCLKRHGDADLTMIEYDYAMIQKMLLKYAFNSARYNGIPSNSFDTEIIDFLLNAQETTPKKYISILCGILPKVPPFLDEITGNQKIQFSTNPIFVIEDTIESHNAHHEPKTIKLPDLKFSCVIRLGIIQFVILCWQKDSSVIHENEVILEKFYPYTLLNPANKSLLPICTSELNYVKIEVILPVYDQSFRMSKIRKISHPELYSSHLYEMWQEEEAKIAKKHPRK